MSIEKKIHYCWFGPNKKPEKIENCIKSWKKYLSDYEFIEWNEENYDISKNTYLSEAYTAGKYAFVSDFARLDILHRVGGIYLDTDMELLQSIDNLLNHEFFIGYEHSNIIAAGIIGAKAGDETIKMFLDKYENRRFIFKDGSYDLTTIVSLITETINENYSINLNGSFVEFDNGKVIYSMDYFYPLAINGDRYFSENTYMIHHYAGSWLSKKGKFRKRFVKITRPLRVLVKKVFGEEFYRKIREIIDTLLGEKHEGVNE